MSCKWTTNPHVEINTVTTAAVPWQMSPQQKRPLEDFFKPHSRSSSIVPHKRPSPTGAGDDGRNTVRRCLPKTPGKSVSFKDVTPKAVKSPLFSPRSQNSLPIRSPNPHQSPTSQTRQTTLFRDLRRSPTREAKHNVSFTFTDVSERSQAVFEHGKVVAVRDSDDDTNSLESLDDIFGRKKDDAATSDSSPQEDTEIERAKMLGLFTSGRSLPIVGKDKLRALYAKEKATRFDLSKVLDDHFGDKETQKNISDMRAGFDGAKDLKDDGSLDRQLLASVVRTGEADEEDVERLLNAVERTEALSAEKLFRFFGSGKASVQPKDAFPITAIPDQAWNPNDTSSQDRAILSGYTFELATEDGLADEALRWMFEHVLKEPRIELRHAYVDCLKASSNTWTRLNVTATDVQSIFRALGADAECLRDASSVEPKHHPAEYQLDHDYQYLLSAIQLFQAICSDMDFLALSKLVSIIWRLCLDTVVMSDKLVCATVEDLLSQLLSLPDLGARSHVHDRILTDVVDHLNHPQLQVQLLGHIPATAPEAANLRKTLADSFLLGSSSVKMRSGQADATLQDLSTYISASPSFSLTRRSQSTQVNYTTLTALVQILNVAVLPGDPGSRQVVSETGSSPKKSDLTDTNFNHIVDHLADHLHTLFVSIKDTGASHMRRTEAKDALQALYFRLLYSVRTRARRKRHVFDSFGEVKGSAVRGRWLSGEEYRQKERGEVFMQRFLGRKADKQVG